MPTWSHTVSPSEPYLMIQCPICEAIHGLANPPAGVLNIAVEHSPECVMTAGGYATALLMGARAGP